MNIDALKKCFRDIDAERGVTSIDEEIDFAAEYFDVLVKGTRSRDCLNGKPLIRTLEVLIRGIMHRAQDKDAVKAVVRRFIGEILDGLRPGGQSIYDEVRGGLKKSLGDDLMPLKDRT